MSVKVKLTIEEDSGTQFLLSDNAKILLKERDSKKYNLAIASRNVLVGDIVCYLGDQCFTVKTVHHVLVGE